MFEYGAAVNDPEFGPAAADADADEEEKAVDSDTGGRWVHHLTRDPLGGEAKYLSFTVIGYVITRMILSRTLMYHSLTIANDMLSLIGSIQPDPFDPRHDASPSRSQEVEEDDEELPAAPLRASMSDDEDADIAKVDQEEEEDAEGLLQKLGREADKVAAKAAKKEKKKKDGENKKEKKRKHESEAAAAEAPRPVEGKKKRRKGSAL